MTYKERKLIAVCGSLDRIVEMANEYFMGTEYIPVNETIVSNRGSGIKTWDLQRKSDGVVINCFFIEYQSKRYRLLAR